MVRLVRWFLTVAVVVFGMASLMHSGVLMQGYEHSRAATAEAVIGAVLLIGLLASAFAPGSSRGIGVTFQAFALLGSGVNPSSS